MHYVPAPDAIEAVQIHIGGPDEYYSISAVNEEDEELLDWFMQFHIHRPAKGIYSIKIDQGPYLNLRDGMYLIKYADNSVDVMSPEMFDKKYVSVNI